MVGVRHDRVRDRPRVIPIVVILVHQNAHQFRNRQHRVGVVELDRDLFTEVVKRRINAQMRADDRLYACGNKEILLLQTQDLAIVGRIVRVHVQTDFLQLL